MRESAPSLMILPVVASSESVVLALSFLIASFNLIVIFIPLYLSQITGLISESVGGLYVCASLIIYVPAVLMWGRWNDLNPPRYQSICMGIAGTMVGTPLLLLAVESRVPKVILGSTLLYLISLSAAYAGCASWQVELWRTTPSVTYTGVAVAHTLSGCVFGGSVPLLGAAMSVSKITNACEAWNVTAMECFEALSLNGVWPLRPLGAYVVALGVVSLWALIFVVEQPPGMRGNRKGKMGPSPIRAHFTKDSTIC